MSGKDWASGGVGGLIEAVRKGHPRHVQLLLEAGVPFDDEDHTGTTPMVAAILTPQEDRLREKLMRLLLQAGADPNVGDSRGTTPLMHAAISNVVPAVVFLLQQDIVDLSLQDGDGNSALMYAAAFGHREIVLLILAAFKKLHHVAVQGQRNGQGLTAWQLAEKNGHEDIAALLKVESQTFGRPAGPSCFIPANPLDLDRPPTPTETPPAVRSSSKRLKNTGRSNTAPEPKDPIAPLQPAHQGNNPSRGSTFSTDSRRRRILKGENNHSSSFREVQSVEPRRTRSEEGPDPSSGGIFSISSGKLRDSEVGLEDRIGLKKQETEARAKEVEKLTNSASVVVRGAVEKVSEEETKGKDLVSRGLNIARCRQASRLVAVSRSNAPLADLRTKWSSRESSRDQEAEEALGKTAETNTNSSSSKGTPASASAPAPVPLSKSSRNDASTRSSEKTSVDEVDRTSTKTESLLVCAPDSTERKVLEELMREFTLAGSPGSGNEADTESLMECEGSPRGSFTATTTTSSSSNITSITNTKMSVPNNNRKMTLTNVPLAVAALTSPNESMPKIDLSSSTRSLNRSIQHLVQEDTENKPGHRPPTPARPSLPTLLPGRFLDTSLNASMASTKSEGRYAPPSRKVTFSSFPRSSSEPRSLTASPRPHQNPDNDYDSDSDEHSSDLLDSSTRSEGWDHLRGARGRGPAYANVSEGHVVTLPPINQSKYLEPGGRGRDGARSRGGAMSTHGENVLSVAKKTLEQLETVLAPSEGPSLSRAIPRTRATHQIHLET